MLTVSDEPDVGVRLIKGMRVGDVTHTIGKKGIRVGDLARTIGIKGYAGRRCDSFHRHEGYSGRGPGVSHEFKAEDEGIRPEDAENEFTHPATTKEWESIGAWRSQGVTRSHRHPEAFINLPYANDYVTLFLGYISGVASFGIRPTAAVLLPADQIQLNKICTLIGRADYSFHDLSWVKLDAKKPRTPRFNMPFELGLAAGKNLIGRVSHHWFVFEAERYRFLKSLGDLNGIVPFIHGNDPQALFKGLLDALAGKRTPRRPTLQEMTKVFHALQRVLPEVERKLGQDVFRTAPFRALRSVAEEFVKRLPTN